MKERPRLSANNFEHLLRQFLNTFVNEGLLSRPPQALNKEEQTKRWDSYYKGRLNSRLDTIFEAHPDLRSTLEAPTFTVLTRDPETGEVTETEVSNMLHLFQTYSQTFEDLLKPHVLFAAIHRELNTGNIALKGDTFKAFDPHFGDDTQDSYDFGKLLFGFTFCDIIANNYSATPTGDNIFSPKHPARV